MMALAIASDHSAEHSQATMWNDRNQILRDITGGAMETKIALARRARGNASSLSLSLSLSLCLSLSLPHSYMRALAPGNALAPATFLS
jgi:hypothetical protein